jgi:hypothetical protein
MNLICIKHYEEIKNIFKHNLKCEIRPLCAGCYYLEDIDSEYDFIPSECNLSIKTVNHNYTEGIHECLKDNTFPFSPYYIDVALSLTNIGCKYRKEVDFFGGMIVCMYDKNCEFKD